MDPAQMNDIESAQVAGQVYEGLVRFKDGSVEVEPCLATFWDVSPDGLTWDFHLRPGVSFSDGAPVDADAVVFSVMRQMDENHPAHVRGRMRYSKLLFGDASSTESALVRSVVAVTTATVRFQLARPYMPFLKNLAMTQASIISPKAARTLGNDLNTTMVGTGAFLLADYDRDQRITIVRNNAYWGTRARLDEVQFQVLRDANTRMNSVRRGDSDVITGIEPYSLKLLEEDKNVTVLSEPSMNLGYLGMNCAVPPFDNPKVRLAMCYAIDRDFIVNVLFNKTSVVATGIIPPGMLGYDPARVGWPYDPARARELLKEAGFPNGFKVTFSTHNRARIYSPVGVILAERVQQDLAAVGVSAELDQMEFPTFLERQKSRQFEMANGGWVSDNGDPDNFLFELVGREDNNLNYSNPEATRLMRAAAAEKDEARRAEMYKRAEALVDLAPPMVPVNHAKQIIAIRKRVNGFVLHPTGINRLDGVWVN
jgi:peptide/nickel transport system substrate-binding protein